MRDGLCCQVSIQVDTLCGVYNGPDSLSLILGIGAPV